MNLGELITTCPGCGHRPHAPGGECEAGVQHGPNRWHRCLCLNQPGASRTCPPQMDCQGGALGYSDVWHLQQGRSLQGASGEVITPDVLKTEPAAVPPADQTDACHRVAEALREADVYGQLERQDDRERFADAVLAVLPVPADRGTVLREAERTMLAYALDQAQEHIWSEDGFTDEDQAAVDSLRRLAGEAQPDEPGTLPAWLYQRFMSDGVGWDNLSEGDRSYWEHQARAVRRAVARGGFKVPATPDAVVAQPTQPQPDETVRVHGIATRFTVNLLPETARNSHAFEITVEYRGHGQWAILRNGWCLDAAGEWDWELRSSERDDDWIAAHRFDMDTALRLAEEQAPHVTVNGLTAADALKRLLASNASP